MSTDCDSLAAALADLHADVTCSATETGTAIVSSGRFFSDGDGVDILVKVSNDGERVVASDGGLTRARLSLHGASAESATAKGLWSNILADRSVEESRDGRIYATGSVDNASIVIASVADACVALDAVRLLEIAERRTFSDRLRDWLKLDAEVKVLPDRIVYDQTGGRQKITAIVESSRGRIAVQGAGGTSISDLRTSAKSAFWIMSGIQDYPIDRRLVVFQSVPHRSQSEIARLSQRLAECSYVSAYDRQDSILKFLKDPSPPQHREFVLNSYGQITSEDPPF